ncbi:helix-turn-helix domain-containing protein [Larkinella sp. VNQ87]|uniref:helix-turn-helix domain-containing protein n=1 Tax=Larkinella sp. VNQ87 TaxID=3400921 RepID=UPI003C07B0D2
MILEINTNQQYQQAMEAIEGFLAKGSAGLSESELAELQRLSLLVEKYEDIHYPMPVEPATLPEMIRLRMFQENLKQKDAARLLGVTETRLSEVLSGKRRVNMDMAKRLNDKLKIRAEFILQRA